MKTTKMSLANIKGKLSRAEMKKIMAGSGTDCLIGEYCAANDQCGAYQGCYCYKEQCMH